MSEIKDPVVTKEQVKEANRKVYEAIAAQYEQIDGRRCASLENYLRNQLLSLRSKSPGGCLLDIGTGSGLVTRCARGIFKTRIGLDLSSKILALNRPFFDFGIAADSDNLPFADKSIDAVTCFSVLHHLYDFKSMVREVARVIKKDGVFYSDHDMDGTFFRRFCLPILVYRKFHDTRLRFYKPDMQITGRLYELAEWQQKGVDSAHLISLLKSAGFLVKAGFHWFGLNPLIDKIAGKTKTGIGWSPLLSIVARKEDI